MTEKAGKAEEVTAFDEDFDVLCNKVDQIKLVTERMLAQVESLIQPNPSECVLPVCSALGHFTLRPDLAPYPGSLIVQPGKKDETTVGPQS